LIIPLEKSYEGLGRSIFFVEFCFKQEKVVLQKTSREPNQSHQNSLSLRLSLVGTAFDNNALTFFATLLRLWN
jgi:hypothetical protein